MTDRMNDYGELGTSLENVGGETRLGLRGRFDQIEPKHKIWLLVGIGVLLAIGGLGWWIARQRAKGK